MVEYLETSFIPFVESSSELFHFSSLGRRLSFLLTTATTITASHYSATILQRNNHPSALHALP
jgi:hypothetical protein